MNTIIIDDEPIVLGEDEEVIEMPLDSPGVALSRSIEWGDALTDEQVGTEAAVAACGPKALLMDAAHAARVAGQRAAVRTAPSNPSSWELSGEARALLRRLALPRQGIAIQGEERRWPSEPHEPISPEAIRELERCFDFVEAHQIGEVRYLEIAPGGREFAEAMEGGHAPPAPALWCEICEAFHRGGSLVHDPPSTL